MTTWAWDEELDARNVLEVILGGRSERVDPGGGSRQLHDFTLTMPSGRTVAVEVTRFADSRALQQRAEVTKRAHLRFPALRYNWQVKIAGTYDVDEWLAAVASVLVRLEHDEFESLLVHRHLEDDEHPAEADLRRMRVRLVYQLGEAGPDGAQIFLAEASVGGSTSPEVVVDVGSMLAAKADNVRKLRSASEDEKHIFVWIDSDQHQAIAAVGSDCLPSGHPHLPPGVDVIWVSTAYDSAHVWSFRAGEAWQDHGAVRLRSAHRA
jgi:hypothetical protein